MAVNNKFVLYQVKREIRRNGTVLKFYRTGKNEYGEPTDEVTDVAAIKGLYYAHAPHILDAYIILTGAQAASTRTKKFPVLLCPWEDLFEPIEEPENPDDVEPVEPEEPTEPGGTGEEDVELELEVENETDGESVDDTEEPTPEVPPEEEPTPEEPVEPVEVPKRCKIQIGDYVMINGHLTHVTGVYNVMEWDLVCHISFEEIDYGSQSLLPGGQKPD